MTIKFHVLSTLSVHPEATHQSIRKLLSAIAAGAMVQPQGVGEDHRTGGPQIQIPRPRKPT